MREEITVNVVRRKGRNLYLRYTDPVDGRRHEQDSGTTNMKAAQRAAGEWQAKLMAGIGGKVTARWEVFTEAYETAVSESLRDKTMSAISVTFNSVEKHMKPDTLARITPQWVTVFQKRLLESGCATSTVESYCRHLRAALNWAQEQGWIHKVPKFPKLKNARSAKLMKGRPVTGEEFDRMIEAVDTEFPIGFDWKQDRIDRMTARRESIKFLLRGLWLSGLRLGEAMTLTWDQWADGIRVDLSGQYAKLLIPAEGEKGGQDRIYPVTPDFAEFLHSVPKELREGFVFNPILSRGVCRRMDTVSNVLCRIGQVAQVKVDEKGGKVVWASAHDLRRAFGARWARLVSSMILRDLMRHASVTTTEKYYVGIQSDETSAVLAALMAKTQTAGAATHHDKRQEQPKR